MKDFGNDAEAKRRYQAQLVVATSQLDAGQAQQLASKLGNQDKKANADQLEEEGLPRSEKRKEKKRFEVIVVCAQPNLLLVSRLS